MVRLLTAAAVLFAGCGEVSPLADPLEQIETSPPPHAEQAIAVASASFAIQTGFAVPAARVRWTSERIPLADGTLASGICRSCEDIWIFWASLPSGDPAPPSNTALAHELGHCVRGVGLGDKDAMHADPAWWDHGFVESAVDDLKQRGL